MSLPFNELPPAPAWQLALALAPALVGTLGAFAARGDDPAGAWRIAHRVSSLALLLSLASLASLGVTGPGAALLVRADLAGGIVAVLVAFIGWVIVRYSQPYLAGEAGEAGYVRALLATLASVFVVVTTNHMLVLAAAWTATSLALHRLLTFYGDRPAALIAAHKKFVLGRVADVAMLLACTLIAFEFNTLRIDTVLEHASALPSLPVSVQAAAVLVAFAAVLKCAQLPFHGWLIQVMEAPTPVSALLHAGVVNLGGFVLIRFAPLVADTPLAAGLLVVVGAFTAVVAALVMTTRISIKVALAWSTCAQMGFMLMQCGLGLWEMALLHLVAHSLYKAHAFLAAGGVVRQTLVRQLAPAAQPASLAGLLAGTAGALALTAAAAFAFGLNGDTPPAVWVMAAVVALALAPMMQGAGHEGAGLAGMRAAATAFALAAVYFALHALLHGRLVAADAMPAQPWWIVVAIAFALLFLLQCALALRPHGTLGTRLYPWFYGGFYLDERFSRALFRLWAPRRPATTTAGPALPHVARGIAAVR